MMFQCGYLLKRDNKLLLKLMQMKQQDVKLCLDGIMEQNLNHYHKKNDKKLLKKVKELKTYLRKEEIIKAVKNTDESIMNVQERIFYVFVKHKFAIGLYVLYLLKNGIK